MTKDMSKEELCVFFKHRKLIFCAKTCAIHIYKLFDRFAYQYLPRNDSGRIKHILCDTLNEAYMLALKEFETCYEARRSINKEVVLYDIGRINDNKDKTEYEILEDFDY